jgi:hypothetical protein
MLSYSRSNLSWRREARFVGVPGWRRGAAHGIHRELLLTLIKPKAYAHE